MRVTAMTQGDRRGGTSGTGQALACLIHFNAADILVETRGVGDEPGAPRALDDIYDTLPPLTPWCDLATPQGLRPAGSLRVGDLVCTHGAAALPIRAIDVQVCDWRMVGLNPFLRPVSISAGALGPNWPLCDLLLAPSAWLSLPMRQGHFLRRASDLVGRAGIGRVDCQDVTYVGLRFDRPITLGLGGLHCESEAPSTAFGARRRHGTAA